MGSNQETATAPSRALPFNSGIDPTYRGPDPLSVQRYDRKDNDLEGEWVLRPSQAGQGPAKLHQFFFGYEDKGILEQDGQDYRVRTDDHDFPNGAWVRYDADAPMLYVHKKCHDIANSQGQPERTCYHADLARIAAGLTRVEKEGQPFRAKGATREQADEAEAVNPESAPADDSEVVGESHPKREQSKKTARHKAPKETPVPVMVPEIKRFKLTETVGVRTRSVELEGIPIPSLHGVLSDAKAAIFDDATDDASDVDTEQDSNEVDIVMDSTEWAAKMFLTLKAGGLYRDEVLTSIFPAYPSWTNDQQDAAKAAMSNARMAKDFNDTIRALGKEAGYDDLEVVAERSQEAGKRRRFIWRLQ